ncbi:hypothetical protein QJ854_gp933 [Moumouvirus goulette]|uniref:Uncharacterized protein n=1 Tax=Moumouvirus goulette TaxID=1247379 RepID=M1PAF9_9VIRU|nr:hypothetical protein QJ854_gp933 [Moumouvirus goulette]AGF84849.1 hypothetical protein glt_00040 [Moumouvirus goulette]
MVKINYICLARINYNLVLIELFNTLSNNIYVKKCTKITILMKSNIHDKKYNGLDKNILDNSKKYFDCKISDYFYYVNKIKKISEFIKFLKKDSEIYSQTNIGTYLWKKISVKFQDFKVIFRSNSINIKTKNNPPQNIQEIEDLIRNTFMNYINCSRMI